MKENFNAYQKNLFVENFTKTDIYSSLVKDFDVVSFENYFYINVNATPRELIGSKRHKTKFSAVAFYYLEYLLEKQPKEIYDLGCGWNIFKRYIPEIIGVAAESPNSPNFYGDLHDYVDDEYIKSHLNFFESVFSICALHFHPLSTFGKIVDDFYSMIQPGGRGFLTLNLQRMIEKDPMFPNSDRNDYEIFCRRELENLNHINFLVVDIDLTYLDSAMDGNIRLVMEK